jgi:hypothetical protein
MSQPAPKAMTAAASGFPWAWRRTSRGVSWIRSAAVDVESDTVEAAEAAASEIRSREAVPKLGVST